MGTPLDISHFHVVFSQKKKKPSVAKQPAQPGGTVSFQEWEEDISEEEEDDLMDNHDPDWVRTPQYKAAAKKTKRKTMGRCKEFNVGGCLCP